MLKASISFFNELSTEKRNYAQGFFLIMASKRIILWKDTMSREKNLVMASKRSSLDGRRITLEGIHVDGLDKGREIDGSNIPIEEITMSTTRSKSQRAELTVRGLTFMIAEGMGQVTPHN